MKSIEAICSMKLVIPFYIQHGRIHTDSSIGSNSKPQFASWTNTSRKLKKVHAAHTGESCEVFNERTNLVGAKFICLQRRMSSLHHRLSSLFVHRDSLREGNCVFTQCGWLILTLFLLLFHPFSSVCSAFEKCPNTLHHRMNEFTIRKVYK